MAQALKTNSRSEQTREALLAAGLEIFGRDGFHAASTRGIAEAAGVNQALIAYHFGGKEGLYLAVFESITGTLKEHMGPAIEQARAEIDALDGSTLDGRRSCLEFLDRLLAGVVGMFSQSRAPGWARLIMREQQDPGEAFEIFYSGVYGTMLDTFTHLVGKLVDRPPDEESTRLLTLSVMGQMMVPMIARATTMRHMNWSDIGEPELHKLHEQVREGLYARFGAEVPA